jgi:glucose-6-phosphate 1-epimerase
MPGRARASNRRRLWPMHIAAPSFPFTRRMTAFTNDPSMTPVSRRRFVERSLAALCMGAGAPAVFARALRAQSDRIPLQSESPVLPKLVLPHPSGAVAEIYLNGAHVTSWKRADGDEMLFLSANSKFVAGEPIRGGIPVVFPQFANLGPLPAHGLVRTAQWQVAETGTDPGGAAFARLETSDTEATRALWPHAFRASLRVALDDALTTALTITNTGDRPFTFQAALHTYHRVGDLRRTTIEGLEGAAYLDRTANGAERIGPAAPLRIEREVDRIYAHRPAQLRIRDAARGRTVLVDRTGFEDAVVWNPGELKGRTNSGLAEGEYLQYVAVESAAIENRISLDAGRSWTGAQRLHVA